ncbi:hypothetical protein NMG60_11013175 [Bertholletia excelsa]
MASRNATNRTCLCSPTTHPGSFRCSLHRNSRGVSGRSAVHTRPSHWELAVMAKAYSLKALLLQVIKPSSHELQRRRNFQPRPTRFFFMNGNRGVTVS